ncbi:uncharacterized protein LOC117220899 [Megalopta genalis]|uniref:uncharacterized protein LOC117220899 n=1 Tax=Megalopta genalis TaxID=115081 RepID=UPI003FD69074
MPKDIGSLKAGISLKSVTQRTHVHTHTATIPGISRYSHCGTLLIRYRCSTDQACSHRLVENCAVQVKKNSGRERHGGLRTSARGSKCRRTRTDERTGDEVAEIAESKKTVVDGNEKKTREDDARQGRSKRILSLRRHRHRTITTTEPPPPSPPPPPPPPPLLAAAAAAAAAPQSPHDRLARVGVIERL